MGHYEFEKDLAAEKPTINDIVKRFSQHGITDITTNNDNRYDIRGKYNNIIYYTTEVKEDFKTEQTNNVFIEYHSRGKNSGIRVTEADYWLQKIHLPSGIEFHMIKTPKLKQLIKTNLWDRTVNGGDPGSNTLGYLFTYNIFSKYTVEIFK